MSPGAEEKTREDFRAEAGALQAGASVLTTLRALAFFSVVVSQPTRETGTRTALGAGRRTVLLLVILEGLVALARGTASVLDNLTL